MYAHHVSREVVVAKVSTTGHLWKARGPLPLGSFSNWQWNPIKHER